MKKLLLLSLFSISTLVNAQTIYLKSGNIKPAANASSIQHWNNWSAYQFQGRNIGIVQFKKSISAKEQEQLTQTYGIRFLQYLPKQAFIASWTNELTATQLQDMGIKSVVPYLPSYKIDPVLTEKPYPTWIQKGADMIEVHVVCLDVAPTATLSPLIAAYAVSKTVQWHNQQTITIIIHESDLSKIAELPFVMAIMPTSAPVQKENLMERTNHRVNTIDASYVSGLHFDGTGVNVGIGDDGVIGPHIDFTGRVSNYATNTTATDTHGDHVAGIVGGAGNWDPTTTGNAKGAQLHIYDYYDNINNAATDYVTQNIRILSNSLGQGCNAGYDNDAHDMDALILSVPSLISVHSSGNSGQQNCGGNSQGFFTITGGYKSGKNAIAVGNVTNEDVLAPSSSKGPAADGRIKPEIVAVGTDVISTQPNNTYDSFTGTSMACPGASGTIADLFQAYQSLNGGNDPYSAVLKAVVMNTADDLGNRGPDFKYGFGRINARRAYNALAANNFFIDSVDNATTKTFTINVPNNVTQLKLMCYWHDVEGNVASSKALVNDINIMLEDANAFTYLPLVLNPANNNTTLNATATEGVDDLNNTEQIVLDFPQPGTYTMYVEGYDIPSGPQKFVVSYEYLTTDSITLTYPTGGESFATGVSERVRWDAFGNNLGSFTLAYSGDAGATWNTIATNIPGNQRYYDWVPPTSLHTGQMLMRVSRGSVTDISDTLFTVLDVPTGLQVDTACGATFHLSWNALTDAEEYTIYQLGPKYMDVIGTSTTNGFYVTSGVNNTGTYYFAVAAAKPSNGAKGRRCITIVKNPGDINCLDDAASLSSSVPYNNEYNCNANLTTTSVSMWVKNVGLRDLYNIPVSYQVDALPIVSENVPGLLVIGDSVQYTFATTANIATAGNHTIRTWVNMLNDLNRNDDTSSTQMNVLAPVVATLPYVQDFEGAVFPPNGWRVLNPDNGVKWQKTVCMSGATFGNTHAAYMDFYNYNTIHQQDDFETLQFNLAPVTTDSVIMFFDIADAYRTDKEDTISLWVTDNCGQTFNATSFKRWGAQLATVGASNTIFSPNQINQWRREQVDLSAFKGSKIFVRFNAINKNGNNFFVDNINVVTKNATPLSTPQANLQEALQVFPNPVKDILHLHWNAASTAVLSYQLTDITGRVVLSAQGNISQSNDIQIDLQQLSKGFYTLAVQQGNNHSTIKLTKK